MATLTVPSRIEFVRPATAFLVQAARALRVPAAQTPVFEVAISEAVTNAVTHRPPHAPDTSLTCELSIENDELTVRVIGGEDAFQLPAPTLPEISPDQIDRIPASGYGVPIMRAVFSTIKVITVGRRYGVELRLPC